MFEHCFCFQNETFIFLMGSMIFEISMLKQFFRQACPVLDNPPCQGSMIRHNKCSSSLRASCARPLGQTPSEIIFSRKSTCTWTENTCQILTAHESKPCSRVWLRFFELPGEIICAKTFDEGQIIQRRMKLQKGKI